MYNSIIRIYLKTRIRSVKPRFPFPMPRFLKILCQNHQMSEEIIDNINLELRPFPILKACPSFD